MRLKDIAALIANRRAAAADPLCGPGPRWPRSINPRKAARYALFASIALTALPVATAAGQGVAETLADAVLADPPARETAPPSDGATRGASAPILRLFLQGGWLMAPIVLMSVVVVAVAVERLLALRRPRVAPRRLSRGLRHLVELGDFDPRSAYRLCDSQPSTAARIIAAMLGKTGRPHAEVEAAVAEASQREADRLYGPVRTLNLAAAVTPLMGLLGTVWGMIAAFFATANMPLGSNKGQVLAEGIYGALVTTFAGLAVAIPAAVLAHYFEGRVLRLMRLIEGLAGELLPLMERFEGGPRIDLAELRGGAPPPRTAAEELPGPIADQTGWPHHEPPPPHGSLAPERRAEPWQP